MYHSQQENGGNMLLFCFKPCSRFCCKNTFVEKPPLNPNWKTSSILNQQICLEVIRDELWEKSCISKKNFILPSRFVSIYLFTALSLTNQSLTQSYTSEKIPFCFDYHRSDVQFYYFLHLILSVSEGIIKVQCQTPALCLAILST